ncbi:helix-turn-helix domain-containing protein [Mycolicibacterium komossense]|uniref:Helix-turn-helix transcriptional regulator n=1 Tax=Mycolicibacterium komossense TaxID=1779 RepID=A0ABT3C9E6_9MYCO|nr:helix-turn-helix transcriptional regulator [Mycolicibacterium komossense]MCV7226102.1 helix-turn-helix transcriptional regulator [Mycolicibacterium komossense]
MTSAVFEQGNIPPSRQPYRLLIARLEAGLQQQELADMMGVGRTVISNAEKGKGPVRKIYLNAWALATGVPISWLETGDGGWYPPEDPDSVRPKGFEPPTF